MSEKALREEITSKITQKQITIPTEGSDTDQEQDTRLPLKELKSEEMEFDLEDHFK